MPSNDIECQYNEHGVCISNQYPLHVCSRDIQGTTPDWKKNTGTYQGDSGFQAAGDFPESKDNELSDIEKHIHMLGCQAMTEARNLGYAEGKGEKPDDSELLDMIDKHEKMLKEAIDTHTQAEVERATEQAQIKGEIIGKRQAYRKAIMGAGEYHDDPYSYVVPIEHLKEYEAELAEFDLDQPIFRDKNLKRKKGE